MRTPKSMHECNARIGWWGSLNSLVDRMCRVLVGVFVAMTALLMASPTLAEKGKLRERLTPEVMAVAVPCGVDRPRLSGGAAPTPPVSQRGQAISPWFFSLDFLHAPRYSTNPFRFIV